MEHFSEDCAGVTSGIEIEHPATLLSPEQTGRVQLARLIFDSRLQPALAGVRNGLGGPDRFVFRGGNLILDVVMAPRRDDDAISMVGQISESVPSGGNVSDLQVSGVQEAGDVSRAVTNGSGEFHMTMKSAKNVLLMIQLRNGCMLVSPLNIGRAQADVC